MKRGAGAFHGQLGAQERESNRWPSTLSRSETLGSSKELYQSAHVPLIETTSKASVARITGTCKPSSQKAHEHLAGSPRCEELTS